MTRAYSLTWMKCCKRGITEDILKNLINKKFNKSMRYLYVKFF
ncbi:hypothetical protein HDEF_0811 [Candidatus Hamiltonella defensa 5AT (Acyrthosiphon pisum)]|uniref:Uncharacterized protein n=1 Tax=Hamiltonella defensa subsp. Acyrthosiphon pisum (strain 5AT) TaxID=572265 RepID=C4K4P4_HAMD5|nr:hypothetical protein HDEF_0811 [Candidatus Hamiltonella defensa 5AT (Acyrthosiphon pisum)]